MKQVSKSKISFIKSLKLKKYRIKENVFVAEGEKIVNEVLKSNLDIKLILKMRVMFQ